jgi:hypothetical protein
MAYIGFRPYPGPDATKITHLPEVVSATYKAGDLVKISGGYVTVATADTDVFGIALNDYTGTTGADTMVYVITPEDKFLAQSSAATLESYKGNAYGCTLTTPGSMCVTAGTTGNATFYIEKLDPRDGVDTSAGGRVIGRFVISSMDAIGG